MKKVANNDLIPGLVSIIVPFYNSEKYLHRCIKSIMNQSYKNVEIILINDGSTDKSREICDEYAQSDGRIRVIHQKNSGPSAARNKGIENSRGEFISFVDSDDSIRDNAISLLVENYNIHKADVTAGDFEIEDPKAGPTEEKFLFSSNTLLEKQDIIDYVRSYLKKPTGYSLFIYNWGKLFKSSIIKDNNICFNTDLHVFEDITFNFEYLKFVNSVSYVKSKVYTYVIHSSPVSAGMKIYDNPVGYGLALKSIKEYLKSKDIDISIIEKEIGNARIFFTIRTMIHFFSFNENVNLRRIYNLIFNMIHDLDIRQSLKFYSPSKGDSRILPILMKLKLVWPILVVCKHKSNKRYVKRGAVR